MDQRVYLKIKLKSLMAEARFIRREERKRLSGKACHRMRHPDPRRHPVEADAQSVIPTCPHPDGDHTPGDDWAGLRNHRLGLRPEVRHTLLAYGFIRGRTYNQMEHGHYAAVLQGKVTKTGHNKPTPDTERVWRMVKKYGPPDATEADVETWVKVGNIGRAL